MLSTLILKEVCFVPIDNHIYNCFSEEEWSQDLQGDFESYQDFVLKGGFGFVILKNNELIGWNFLRVSLP